MSCATNCLKCLVILCNVILATIGLVMLAGGIFLMTGAQKYIDQYTTEFVKSAAKPSDNWTTTSPHSSMDDDDGGGPSPDFSAFITPFGIVLIVFGAFITLVGLTGIFGVCCSSRVLLVLYAVVTILLVIAEIIITILFFMHVFDDGIRSRANNTLTEDYVGLNDLGQESLTWNYIMINLECCGLDSYEDFKSAKKWLGNSRVENEISQFNGDQPPNSSQVTPLACCKQTSNFQSEFVCSTNPTNETSNWKTGCWNEVTAAFLPYRTLTIALISAILVAQTLLALMAILIAWRLPKTWNNI
jgi:tetraspanin-18